MKSAEPVGRKSAGPDLTGLESKTIAELKQFAKENDLTLTKTKKSEIIEEIRRQVSENA